jgi:hypothetical protein
MVKCLSCIRLLQAVFNITTSVVNGSLQVMIAVLWIIAPRFNFSSVSKNLGIVGLCIFFFTLDHLKFENKFYSRIFFNKNFPWNVPLTV